MSVHVGYISFMEPSKGGAIATGWHIDNLLQSLWYLFSDASAKKEDYMKVSTSEKFPLQFCATRWLEDVAAAEKEPFSYSQISKCL